MILTSGLCDYSDEYLLVTGTISVTNMEAHGVDGNNDKIMKYLKIVLHLLNT